MEIIKHGRNSKEGLKRKITFYCDNKDCECIFRESLNSNNIYVNIDEYDLYRAFIEVGDMFNYDKEE